MHTVRVRRAARRRVPAAGATRAGDRSPAEALLALQRAAGNRAVAAMLQRRGAQDLLDKPITLAAPRPQVMDDEIVPIGEAPGRFDGFATKADALAAARRSPEVTVVVSDGKRFHVLRTTATMLGGTTAPPTLPKGWNVVEVLEPKAPLSASTFAADYQAARDASGDDQATRFRRLLVRGTHLDLDETAWSPTEERHVEGKVNVALWLQTAGRHLPSKVEPTGSAELPRTTILIGKTPFTEGAASVRATLLHESRHAYHRARTLELIREWRKVRKTDSADAWYLWLRGRRKSLPIEVYDTSKAATTRNIGTAATETYSYLFGFMYRFRRDDDAAANPATMDAAVKKALHSRMIELYGVGENWEAAGQEVRDATLDRLVAFAATLTPHHREHLRQFMIANATGGGRAPKVFYERLATRL
jgi:hypothetical protein